MSNILISLDLSTACTGIAIFSIKNKKLTKYYSIKPNTKGMSKLDTLETALLKIQDLSNQLKVILKTLKPDVILIEQVNRGINRISQKTLDALHFFIIKEIYDLKMLDKIVYKDSNGKSGWRGNLGLRLSDEDKKANKKARANNKNSKIKVEVVNWKTLACRYVEKNFKLKLDQAKENDIADAICLGIAYLTYDYKK